MLRLEKSAHGSQAFSGARGEAHHASGLTRRQRHSRSWRCLAWQLRPEPKPAASHHPRRLDIINLAVPFFGVIFIGFACGKWRRIPDQGLAWINFFILYVALPTLFFRILSKTPLQQLAQIDFMATTLATCCAFTVAFVFDLMLRRGRIGEATLAGVDGGFGNARLHGARPGAGDAWTGGGRAGGPRLLLRCAPDFRMVPLLMAFSGTGNVTVGRALVAVVRSIARNRLLLAAALGTAAAALNLEPPVAADCRSVACFPTYSSLPRSS